MLTLLRLLTYIYIYIYACLQHILFHDLVFLVHTFRNVFSAHAWHFSAFPCIGHSRHKYIFPSLNCNRLKVDIHVSEELEMQPCILLPQMDKNKLNHLPTNSPLKCTQFACTDHALKCLTPTWVTNQHPCITCTELSGQLANRTMFSANYLLTCKTVFIPNSHLGYSNNYWLDLEIFSTKLRQIVPVSSLTTKGIK